MVEGRRVNREQKIRLMARAFAPAHDSANPIGFTDRPCTTCHNLPRNDPATTQAAPVIAADTQISDRLPGSAGFTMTTGTHTRIVKRLTMIAVRVAASRARTPERMERPPAIQAAPVKYAS